jgi:hypothetical protein
MRNSIAWLCLAAGAALGQSGEPLDAASAIRFRFAPGLPLSVVSSDLGDSRVQVRGGAMVLDLHATVALKNTGGQHVRGVTLLVLAQEMTPGGKGSVAAPSLNVAPGQTFPVRINLRLLRPLPAPPGPLVEVALDGVLLADFSFFGPNRLDSRRTLTAWELEARRDREHLKAVLAKGGPEAVRQEMLASLARQQSRPRLDVQVSRGGPRALSAAVHALTAKNLNFAFLKLPDAPLEPVTGAVQVNGAEAYSPRIEVTNRSNRPVRYFEVGWIVKDASGRDFLAGSVPSSAGEVPPGGTATAAQNRTYKFGLPSIGGTAGFIGQVEFADGSIWIPSRRALSEGGLLNILPVSPEEQRLSQLYRANGLQVLIEELGRF